MTSYVNADYSIKDISAPESIDEVSVLELSSSTRLPFQLKEYKRRPFPYIQWPPRLDQAQILLLTGGATLCSSWLAVTIADTIVGGVEHSPESTSFTFPEKDPTEDSDVSEIIPPEVNLAQSRTVTFSPQSSSPKILNKTLTIEDSEISKNVAEKTAQQVPPLAKSEVAIRQYHASDKINSVISVANSLPETDVDAAKPHDIDSESVSIKDLTARDIRISQADTIDAIQPTIVNPLPQIPSEEEAKQNIVFDELEGNSEQAEVETVENLNLIEDNHIQVNHLDRFDKFSTLVSSSVLMNRFNSSDAVMSNDCSNVKCVDSESSEFIISEGEARAIELSLELSGQSGKLANLADYSLPENHALITSEEVTHEELIAQRVNQVVQRVSGVDGTAAQQLEESDYFKRFILANDIYRASLQDLQIMEKQIAYNSTEDNDTSNQLAAVSAEHSKIHGQWRLALQDLFIDHISSRNIQVSEEVLNELEEMFYCQQLTALSSNDLSLAEALPIEPSINTPISCHSYIALQPTFTKER